MASFPAIKMTFRGPLHLSLGRQDDDSDSQQWLPSDALSAALVACAVELFGNEIDPKAFLDGFEVSSAFPFFEKEFFFPKPFFKPLEIEESGSRKAEKKVVWYGQSFFEKWLDGSKTAFAESQLSENSRFLTENAAARATDFLKTNVEQRVAVPRWAEGVDAEPITFYQERLSFSAGAGLFFLFKIDENWRPHFEAALRLLADNGIGSDRTNGNGQFSFEKTSLEIRQPATADRHISLGLFCPKKGNLKEEHLKGYQLIERGGYVASPAVESWTSYRKRSVWMFREGSVFSKMMKGETVDLAPSIVKKEAGSHPIWRDGRGFFLSKS